MGGIDVLVNNAGYAYRGEIESLDVEQMKTMFDTKVFGLVDITNRIWLLRANLLVRDGCSLLLHGTAAGGDVNELRLQSVNADPGCPCVVSVTADWVTLDIQSTKITSWDTMTGTPDTDPLANGRAFLRARSSLSTNGLTPLESRMDITDSELCFLGADASEASLAAREAISAEVRMGELEGMEREEGRSVALRAFIGKRQAAASSTDLSAAGLQALAERVVAMAKAAP